MPAVEESVFINLPRSEVFASMLNPENIVIWSTNTVGYEVVTGSLGEDDVQVKLKIKIAGKIIEGTGEAVEVEESRRVKSRIVDSPIPTGIETHFQDAEGGTRLTQRWDLEIPRGFFGELDDELVTRLYATDLRSNLEKLKILLESQKT